MASRTRRKSSPAPKSIPVAAGKEIPASKSSRRLTKIDDNASDGEKENKSKPARGKPKPPNKSAHDGKIKDRTTYCLCNQPDDGTPMVCCSLCNEWCAISSVIWGPATSMHNTGIISGVSTLVRRRHQSLVRDFLSPVAISTYPSLQRFMFALLALRRPVNAV